MSSRPLRLVASNPALRRLQMSRPSAFGPSAFGSGTFAPAGGRGRSYVTRPEPRRELTRDQFLRWWSGLLLRKLGSARAVAQFFETTEQTGRNWIDGTACPTGLSVMRALRAWPQEFSVGAV